MAELVFSTHAGTKRRPVVVVYDGGDDDLLVVPVTTHASRTTYDIPLAEWQQAGLRGASVVRMEKLATIAKTTVVHEIGRLSAKDWPVAEAALQQLFSAILDQ